MVSEKHFPVAFPTWSPFTLFLPPHLPQSGRQVGGIRGKADNAKELCHEKNELQGSVWETKGFQMWLDCQNLQQIAVLYGWLARTRSPCIKNGSFCASHLVSYSPAELTGGLPCVNPIQRYPGRLKSERSSQIDHIHQLNAAFNDWMVIIIGKEIRNDMRTNKPALFIERNSRRTVTCSNLQDRITSFKRIELLHKIFSFTGQALKFLSLQRLTVCLWQGSLYIFCSMTVPILKWLILYFEKRPRFTCFCGEIFTRR
jgi:hypothetical protein